MKSRELPLELITNTETKAVSLTPQVEATLKGVDKAFQEVDIAFLDDPEAYLANLENSLFKFRSSEGSKVACSLLHNSDSLTDELLVIFAPFSDRDPKSSSATMHDYISADAPLGILGKEKASPNSWSQTTKSAVIFDVLGALGKNMPVLTIYSPIPFHAYSFKERGLLRNGDFSPTARLAQEAIAEAQDRLHGANGPTQIDTVHFSGASLGSAYAIGASSALIDREFKVPTLTAQELILGPKNLVDLGKRFTVSQYVGEASDETTSQNAPKISEAALRKEIDKYGSEPIGMTARMVKGMKLTYLKGLTRPEATVQALEHLLDKNADVLVALAENSALTHQTAGYLPNGGEGIIRIRGEDGQKIGHLADEHVALSALVVALNIARTRND